MKQILQIKNMLLLFMILIIIPALSLFSQSDTEEKDPDVPSWKTDKKEKTDKEKKADKKKKADKNYKLTPFKLRKLAPRKRKEKNIENFRVKSSQKNINKKKKKKKVKKMRYIYAVNLKGGLSMGAPSDGTTKTDFGFHATALIANEFYIFDHFTFEIDFGYHNSSFSYSGQSLSISYFTIPILFKLNILSGLSGNLWLGFGFEFRAKLAASGFGGDFNSPNSIDQGFLLSLGGKIRVHKNIGILLETRYYIGMTTTFTDGGGNTYRSRDLIFLAGVSFEVFG